MSGPFNFDCKVFKGTTGNIHDVDGDDLDVDTIFGGKKRKKTRKIEAVAKRPHKALIDVDDEEKEEEEDEILSHDKKSTAQYVDDLFASSSSSVSEPISRIDEIKDDQLIRAKAILERVDKVKEKIAILDVSNDTDDATDQPLTPTFNFPVIRKAQERSTARQAQYKGLSNSKPTTTIAAAVSMAPMIMVKTRLNGTHTQKWKLTKEESFRNLKMAFAKLYKVETLTEIKFSFDGDPLDDDDTPTSVDMDDDNMIDADIPKARLTQALEAATQFRSRSAENEVVVVGGGDDVFERMGGGSSFTDLRLPTATASSKSSSSSSSTALTHVTITVAKELTVSGVEAKTSFQVREAITVQELHDSLVQKAERLRPCAPSYHRCDEWGASAGATIPMETTLGALRDADGGGRGGAEDVGGAGRGGARLFARAGAINFTVDVKELPVVAGAQTAMSIPVRVFPDQFVSKVRAHLAASMRVPADHMVLKLGRKVLVDTVTLYAAGVVEGSCVKVKYKP